MKLPLSAIVSSFVFAFAKGTSVSGTDLQKRWAIGNPTTDYVPATNTFTMIYPDTDDSIMASNLRVSFFDKNCKNPVEIDGEDTPSQYVLDDGIDDIIVTKEKQTKEKQTYVFPTTDSANNTEQGFVHGLCVLGATSTTASSSDLDFTYTPLTSVFAEGIKLWGDTNFVSVGVEDGGAELCEGGVYLQPSGTFVSFIYYHIWCKF